MGFFFKLTKADVAAEQIPWQAAYFGSDGNDSLYPYFKAEIQRKQFSAVYPGIHSSAAGS